MKSNFIERVQRLRLPKGQYMVCGSAILDILNIRQAGDIDLLVSPKLYSKLTLSGWTPHPKYQESIEHPDGIAGAKLRLDFMRENYTLVELLPDAVVFEDIHFMSLKTLREAKVQLGRQKDLKDIELIDIYCSR